MALDGDLHHSNAPAALPQEVGLPVLVLNRRLGGLKNRPGRSAEEKNLLLLQVLRPVVQ